MSAPQQRFGHGYRGRDHEPWSDLWKRLAWLHGPEEADRRFGALEAGEDADLLEWRYLGWPA